MTSMSAVSSTLSAMQPKMVATDADGDNDGTVAAAPVAPQPSRGPASVVSLSPAAQALLQKAGG